MALTNRIRLRSELIFITDNSPCSYETVIEELQRQLKFWKSDLRRETKAIASESKGNETQGYQRRKT